jgi:hypothetical protein
MSPFITTVTVRRAVGCEVVGVSPVGDVGPVGEGVAGGEAAAVDEPLAPPTGDGELVAELVRSGGVDPESVDLQPVRHASSTAAVAAARRGVLRLCRQARCRSGISRR